MLHRYDTKSHLNTIWDALEGYHENCINPDEDAEEWDDITTAMAWIKEDLEDNKALDIKNFLTQKIKNLDISQYLLAKEILKKFFNKDLE